MPFGPTSQVPLGGASAYGSSGLASASASQSYASYSSVPAGSPKFNPYGTQPGGLFSGSLMKGGGTPTQNFTTGMMFATAIGGLVSARQNQSFAGQNADEIRRAADENWNRALREIRFTAGEARARSGASGLVGDVSKDAAASPNVAITQFEKESKRQARENRRSAYETAKQIEDAAKGGMFSSVLGAVGTVVGAVYGGPAGAAIGGTIGSSVGAAVG